VVVRQWSIGGVEALRQLDVPRQCGFNAAIGSPPSDSSAANTIDGARLTLCDGEQAPLLPGFGSWRFNYDARPRPNRMLCCSAYVVVDLGVGTTWLAGVQANKFVRSTRPYGRVDDGSVGDYRSSSWAAARFSDS